MLGKISHIHKYERPFSWKWKVLKCVADHQIIWSMRSEWGRSPLQVESHCIQEDSVELNRAPDYRRFDGAPGHPIWNWLPPDQISCLIRDSLHFILFNPSLGWMFFSPNCFVNPTSSTLDVRYIPVLFSLRGISVEIQIPRPILLNFATQKTKIHYVTLRTYRWNSQASWFFSTLDRVVVPDESVLKFEVG